MIFPFPGNHIFHCNSRFSFYFFSLSKCEKHVDEKRVASSDDKENCCPVKGQSALAWNLKDHGKEVVVKVDEVTQTVCLVFGPKTLVVRKLDIFPHDLLDGWRDVPDTAGNIKTT